MMWDYVIPWAAGLLIVYLVARRVFGLEPRQASRDRKYRTCPRCTAPLRWEQRDCDVCRWPAPVDAGERPQQVYQAVHRMLFRFRELGVLTEAKYQSLLEATDATLRGDSQSLAAEPETPQAEHRQAESAPPETDKQTTKVETYPAATPKEAEPSTPPAGLGQKTPVHELVPGSATPDTRAATRPPETAASPVESRVTQYAARREAAATVVNGSPPTPPRRRRDWGRLFQAFLEENNIMWGELVGGLLIVTCSIALVISFWAEIAERPLLKFSIFNGVSAALFGAGFYTDRRWKIRTTSHGVLIIAILLVPLNFLAIAAFTSSSPPTEFLSLAGETLSLAVFSALTYFAARVVTPHAPLATTVCVMANCLLQLLIRRYAGPESSLLLTYGLATLPAGSFALASAVSLRRSARGDASGDVAAPPHFPLLGMCLFATLLPLALLLHKTGDIAATLQQLAPLLVLLGGPLLATAIAFWRRFDDGPTALKVATGSVAVLGGIFFFASVVLAWPLPYALFATAIANGLLWTALAWLADRPRLNFLAAASLVLAWLVGGAVYSGEVSWSVGDASGLVDSVLSAAGGARLLPTVGLLAAIAAGYWRIRWRPAAEAWALSAGAVAASGFLLLLAFGFGRVGDPANATWYFIAYAALATAAAARLDHAKLAWASVGLTLVATVEALVFRYGAGWYDTASWILALLVFSSLAAGVSAAAQTWKKHKTAEFRKRLAFAALSASMVVAGLLLALGWKLSYAQVAIDFGWVGALWLVLAWLGRQADLALAFQLAIAAATAVLVSWHLSEQAWFAEGASRWIDPYFWQAQGIALALAAIIWRLLRLVASKRAGWGAGTDISFNNWPWSAFDRSVATGMFALVCAMAVYAVLPGVAQELSPSIDSATRVPAAIASFELPHISSAHAAGTGSWWLLAGTVVLVALGCWDHRPGLSLMALYLMGIAACLLGASLFSDQTASASALRWLLGVYTLLAAVPIVARNRLRPLLDKLGIEGRAFSPVRGFSSSQSARALVVTSVAGLYVAIAALASWSAIRMGPPTPRAETMLMGAGAVALVAGVIWLGLGWRWQSVRLSGGDAGLPTRFASLSRTVIGIAAILPLLIVAAFIVASKLTARPLVGPDPGSWFAELGNSLLYGGPLAMFAAVLLAFAIRELSSRYAASFGLLMGGLATLVYLLELAAGGRPLDALAWIELAQLNAAVLAIVALGWWATIAWWHRGDLASAPRPPLLQALAGLAMLFVVETLVAGCCGIFAEPVQLTWQSAVADTKGLVSMVLATTALLLTTKPRGRSLYPLQVVGLVALAVMLAPNVVVQFDRGEWEAYHTLLLTSAVAAWALILPGAPWRSTAWATVFTAFTTLVALRELVAGRAAPQWPWWSIAGLLTVYGALLAIGLLRHRRWPLWLSAPVLGLAGHTWWWNTIPQAGANQAVDFLDLSAIVLAVAAIASVVIEIRWNHHASTDSDRGPWVIGLHRAAVWLSIACLFLAAAVEMFVDFGVARWPTHWWMAPLALAAGLVAIFATLWDRHVRWPVAALYCLGLAAVGRFLGMLKLEGDAFTWSITLALAAFILATSYLWNRRDAISVWAMKLGAPEHLRARIHSPVWMLSANGVLISLVIALVTYVEFTHTQFNYRMTAAYTLLACGVSLALMATGRVETILRYLALSLGALFAVAFAAAWIPPTMPLANLHRLVAAGVAVAAVIPIYGTLLVKIWRRTNAWVEAAQQTIPALVAIAGVLLGVTLATEAGFFVSDRDAPLVWPAVLAVALAVAALAVSSLAAAIVPGRDPLNLSERGRTIYVYAAEAFLGLLFLHIRVTMPWLFAGWFDQYWPFIVMLIAFIGAGLSEWFARRKSNVLAEPLANTGLLLPLLPVISFWSSGGAGEYAMLLVAVGALYTTMSVMRKSPMLLGFALLAFNGSLWTMLHTVEGLGLLEHPQFWLIPPVLCVLVGAELNRTRIKAGELSATRYGCATMIYAASTADIVINGVGQGLWMPMALAALALVGVFAGIMLRVRAFLFLGIAFLCVALFSVVWHAAVELERTWIWWVAGIVTGAAIIVMFGLFEKKRDEAVALLERLKQWEA